jgi:hypothetical protein
MTTKDRGKFEGDYVRGGQRTLFLTRSDLVEALAMVRDRYPGQLRGILTESAQELARVREDRGVERERELSGRCRCRFVRTGSPLDRSRCGIHKVPYGCDSCGCDEFRPATRKLGHDHWPLCACGHIAQAHNRRTACTCSGAETGAAHSHWCPQYVASLDDDPMGRWHGRNE